MSIKKKDQQLAVTFITSNKEKIADIKTIVGDKFPIAFDKKLVLPEIQSLSVKAVATYKAKKAFEILKKPVVVSDSGLEIFALKKFPGALVKYVNMTIGQEGLIKLLEGKNNRDAFFVAALAYCDKNGCQVFIQKDKGIIAKKPRGNGWHFDKIFIPQGETKTWAEIGRKKKNKDSAFKRALTELIIWLRKE
ncbi:MAG: non-canonical purine NTP pyrophosphatase [Asgard group archaeon]|nr:non-canonical purine NTP pyrophosphatase [Asgard group archaeon]